jgi:L-lactate dehydrogenase complex protein LldF
MSLKVWAWAAARPGIYAELTRIAARLGHWAGGRSGLIHNLPAGASWTRDRDLPAPEGRTFRELYAGRMQRRT